MSSKVFPPLSYSSVINDSSSKSGGDFEAVAATFVPLHVAADAEGLSTPGVRALEWLLASVRVAVNSKAARPAEGLVARLADVPILALWVRRPVRGVEVVVVLPGVGPVHGDRHRWREDLGQRALIEEAMNLR